MSDPVVFAPLTEGGACSFLRGPIAVERSPERLVLSQRPGVIFKALAACCLIGLVLSACILFDRVANNKTTTLKCARATGVCTLKHEGVTRSDLPPLSEVVAAEVASSHAHRQGGDFAFVYLILRDGRRVPITPEGGQNRDSVSGCQAMAAAINAFLADPGALTLDVSAVYSASLWEKVNAGLMLAGMLALTLAAGATFSISTVTFDRVAGRVIFKRSRPIGGRSALELPLSGVSEVRDRRSRTGARTVELALIGGTAVAVASAGAASAALDAIARELGGLLGRPVNVQDDDR